MLWGVCRLVAPANAPLLAGVRVGAIVYYLAFCALLLLTPDFVDSLYHINPWGHYLVWGMGLKHDDDFHNVFVLALWIAVPTGWLAARYTYRNLPY